MTCAGRSAWTGRRGRPHSRATTTRPSAARPAPRRPRNRGWPPVGVAHGPQRRSAGAAGGRARAEQSYEVAAALLPATGAEAERAQVLAAHSAALLQVAGVRGRAHGRAAGVGAGPPCRCAHRRGRVLSVLGFSLGLPRGRDRGRRRPRRGRGRGGGHRRAGGHHRGPRAPGRAARRAAEPARRGHRRTRARGLERMRELGLARTAGVALLTYAANALFRWGGGTRPRARSRRRRGTAADRRGRARRAAGPLPHRRSPAGGLTPPRPGPGGRRAAGRAAAGPRQRLPLLVLFTALALWRRRPRSALRARRGRVRRGRGGRGRHPGRGPAGVARDVGVGRPW